jgi:predicted ester cyclase
MSNSQLIETAEDLVRRAISSFDRQELTTEQLARVFTDDAELYVAGVTLRGLDHISAGLNNFYTGFPDLVHEVLSAIGDGTDVVAVEHRINGTHRGPFVTAAGTLEPTGKTVEWFSASVVRFAAGKIRSWSIYQEQLGILGQLTEVSLARRPSG